MDAVPAGGSDALLERARAALHERFGHPRFLPGQEAAIARILAGESLTVVMPTGAGKSLCFQVPALVREGLTLVVSPLIALMKDQVEALTGRGLPADFVNSTIAPPEQRRRLDAAMAGRTRLLYVAPERLATPAFLSAMERTRIAFVAVDEAHCISQWGHDFRPAYLGIATFLDAMAAAHGSRPQVVALTATATPRVRADVASQLGLDRDRLLITGFRRPNLRLVARRCDRRGERIDQVVSIIRGVGGSGIVYCGTRRDVEEVADALVACGVSAGAYHAGLADEERSRVQEDFQADRVAVIVATNAFGMGIDKPDIRFVVHHSLPGSLEAYYQEAGRAGRDGKPAWCVLIHGSSDRYLHEFFIDGSNPPEEAVLATWQALRLRAARQPGQALDLAVADVAEAAGVAENVAGGALRALEEAGLVERRDEREGAESGRGRRRAIVVPEPNLRVAEAAARLAPWLRASAARRQRAFERLDRMAHYAHARRCRHRFLLSYFGDDEPFECRACDHCRGWESKAAAPVPRRQRALPSAEVAAEARAAALAAVAELELRFGLGVVRLVLRGSRSRKVVDTGLDRSTSYGALARLSAGQVDDLLRGLQAEGLVETTEGPYPVVRLTEEGRLGTAASPG